MSRILFVDRRGKGRSPDFSPLGGPHRQERQCDTRSRRYENYKPHRRCIIAHLAVGYRAGTITSFPLGDPVLSSSTTAGIASDSGTMRPIAGTSLPCSAASETPARDCGVGLPNTK